MLSSNLLKGTYISVCVIALFFVSYSRAYYNFDIIAYVALAYELTGLSGEALRIATYSDVEAFVPSSTYSQLIDEGPPYRWTIYQEFEALEHNSHSTEFAIFTSGPSILWEE